jgi:hypothetical protein
MALRNTMLKAHKQVIVTVFVKPEINKKTWNPRGNSVAFCGSSPLSSFPGLELYFNYLSEYGPKHTVVKVTVPTEYARGNAYMLYLTSM